MASWFSGVLGLLLAVCVVPAHAQPDPARGARLYLQLPGSNTSCVDCHGTEPRDSRNNLLLAADRPSVLTRALGGIAAMGFLRAAVGPSEIDDIAAYLGVVRAGLSAPVRVWPSAIDFGLLQAGTLAPEHRLWVRADGTVPVDLGSPELLGEGAPGNFELHHDCPATLNPGQRCTLRVRAVRSEAGDASATLRLATASVVPIAARWGSEPVGALTSEPAGSDGDLGPITVGQVGTAALSLLNLGPAPLTLLAPSLSGPDAGTFALDSGCSAGTFLLPGERCTVQVTATPARVGVHEAALQWRSNGRSLPPLALVVTAPASAPASAPAVLGPLYTGGGAGLSSLLMLALIVATVLLTFKGRAHPVTGRSRPSHAGVTPRS